MKLQINIFIILYVFVVFLPACNLDVIPPAEISAESYWKTEKDAWYALNSCYSEMKAMDIWDEMCTDNAHSHKPWEGNFELVQQNGISTAATYGNYSFGSVRLANNFLKNVENCVMDENLKARMKAEARFFRAFSYLELTQYFGKIAIITEVLPYDADNVPRDPIEKVHTFILNELEEISKILPEKYAGGYMNEIGRITRYGALALRARAALYFGNYKEAEKSAKAVIYSGKHALYRISSALDDAQNKEAAEMDLYIDFDELGVNKEKFIKGMFSYETLWQKGNASPTNPEYVVTREYMADANNYDWTRYTYMIPLSMSIHHGYSSFEPMQDLVDAYWDIDGKTIRNDISVEQRAKNYNLIWEHAKNLSEDDYNTFAASSNLMSYDYMKEFKNRDVAYM